VLIALSRNKKRTIFLVSDCVSLIICCWLSFALRYGDWLANGLVHWPVYLLAPIVSIPIFIRLGLYRAVIRYIGNKALWTVIKAVTLSVFIWATITYLLGLPNPVPRSVILIYWLVTLVVVGGTRIFARWLILHQLPGGEQKIKNGATRVIIYGAGSSGRQLTEALYHSAEFTSVAYIDDSKALQGREINSLGVHSVANIDNLIEQYAVDSILLAIPSAPNYRKKEIIDKLSVLNIKILTLPGLSDIAGGKVKISDVREIDIIDLLGREEVSPHQHLLDHCICGQNVLITGAGGSIGSELCRQIVNQQPSFVVLYELSEFALYQIEKELIQNLDSNIKLIPILGNVLDQALLEKVMNLYSIDTVYHAAAYKHVPIVEENIIAGVKNNLLGTWFIAEAALKCGIKNFVLISSDKAVRPTNVMGASKRFAELVLQAMAYREQNTSITRFTMVRFGNVLGSSGSVIPVFKQQIELGGPVTVTHPEMSRYFMTIPEAASLVLQAGALGTSGDVFVLDMGLPVKIKSLAKKMINLSGRSVKDEINPDGEIEIVFSGLRDGEKLYEELLIGDVVQSTEHPMIMRASEEMLSWSELKKSLEAIIISLDEFEYDRIREILLDVVKGYNPQHEIHDLIYVKKSKLRKAL
jgi:FlaA1/EpsC-like NDP-sugar epimerase